MEEIDQQVRVKRFSFRLIFVIGIFALILFLLATITDEIVIEKESGFDTTIANFLQQFRNDGITRFMIFFTFFGSRAFLLPAYSLIVAYYLFFKKSTRRSLSIAVVALSGAGILTLAKNTFRRSRPLEPLVDRVTSFSYPSGHSFSAFTFCGILAYLLWISEIKQLYKWILTIMLVLFAATVAASRVYLNVHYASDVIAGFCLSLLWLGICYFILLKLKIRK